MFQKNICERLLKDEVFGLNINPLKTDSATWRLIQVLKLMYSFRNKWNFHFFPSGSDYTILVCWDEISTCRAGTDFTLRLHGVIKFHACNAGQFSRWYLLRFVSFFFWFSFVRIYSITFASHLGGLKRLLGKISSRQNGIPAVPCNHKI